MKVARLLYLLQDGLFGEAAMLQLRAITPAATKL
jgi:hypothetical protein